VESGSALAVQSLAATQATVIARVLKDANRVFGDTIEQATLAAWAEVAVTELWGESVKVTSFLPVLAMRQISLRAAELSHVEDA